jgi:hypothetical protein
MAETKAETYNMSEAFTRRNFESSTEEIDRMVNRWRRLLEAKKFAAAPPKDASRGGITNAEGRWPRFRFRKASENGLPVKRIRVV